jgi:alkanesulfonate monooxygenase SsuD/methylene tetrahydromethanopterin reductase-like flavin-dependent oxidoreductase (luciferase family)
MSGGRVELGLGTGWFAREHEAYGIPFPAKRFDLLEEQLELLTGLWSTPAGETYSFEGAHYRLTDAPALPKPVQRRIPLIVGGGGPRRTPDLAARYATEFNIGFRSEEESAQKFAGVRQACERAGRDPASLKLSVALPTVAGASAADLDRRAARIDRTVDELRGDVNIVGDRDEIVAKVERLAALGAQRVYFQLLDLQDVSHVEYLGEVLPHLPR